MQTNTKVNIVPREEKIKRCTGKRITVKHRQIESGDNTALAEMIRHNLKQHGLNLPGTVYYDDNLYRLSAFYKERPDKRSYFVLLDEEDSLIGGIGLAEFDGIAQCAELQKFYLTDAVKGHGIGYFLIELVEEEALRLGYERIYLETHDNLAAACHMYEKTGYQRISKPEGVVHSAMNLFYLKELRDS